ncbi:mechanosensitive ion channel family protein [Ulvibacter antarcticus]|uniref:Small conductance mechanosensitive channel n=1 Tax=Ulvibacter antarcticus TaxID=442714 RepID=A0A3L9YGY7_9FLAO|nr:mechanosensitive ion channel [Ulvibacter antarcticus]RMA57148.1 small conductance mechanosensitive channel [Ulvibacter antarcticus]
MNDKITNSFQDITDKLWGWLSGLIENLPNIGIAILVLVIAYFLSKFISKTVKKIAGKYVSQESITKLIARAVAVVVVLGGLFLALGVLNLGKALSAILAGAGISGLVIGLAMQGTLSNTFSGIVLSFRKNIRIGDWVETNGFTGEIMDINLSNFVLKEPDNKLVLIPNKTILENPLKNYSLTPKMRIIIECGVGYEMDLEKVEKITKETIAKTFDTVNSPDEVEFFYTEFGGSSVNFICRYWVEATRGKEKLHLKSVGMKAIRKAFNEADINIPFPIRTLQFDNKLSLQNNSGSQEHE